MLTTILLVAAKVFLLVFVIGGAAAIVIRGMRRSRANRGDPRWNEFRTPPGHEASAYGATPLTPLPDWAYWDRDADQDDRK
jgi:hypothetical protein